MNISSDTVLVASTGVIGFTLPMDVIADGVKKLSGMLKSDVQSAQDAAEAILTTDTHPKQIAYETTIGGKTVTFGAMCKGSGMIHPNMGTMLGFIMTDAAISKNLLDKALKGSIEDTFNMVSVDGDTSTNDTVLVMAMVWQVTRRLPRRTKITRHSRRHCSQSILILQSRSPVTERGQAVCSRCR